MLLLNIPTYLHTYVYILTLLTQTIQSIKQQYYNTHSLVYPLLRVYLLTLHSYKHTYWLTHSHSYVYIHTDVLNHLNSYTHDNLSFNIRTITLTHLLVHVYTLVHVSTLTYSLDMYTVTSTHFYKLTTSIIHTRKHTYLITRTRTCLSYKYTHSVTFNTNKQTRTIIHSYNKLVYPSYTHLNKRRYILPYKFTEPLIFVDTQTHIYTGTRTNSKTITHPLPLTQSPL